MQVLQQVQVEVSSFEVEATPVCDLVLICDGAVAMVVVVVVVVVTVVDDSPVVAVVTVSDFDFLGEGSQPFSEGRECFWECPVTIVSSRGNGTSSVHFSFSSANFEIAASAYSISSVQMFNHAFQSAFQKRLFGDQL